MFTTAHTYFLQSVIKYECLNSDEACDLYAKICVDEHEIVDLTILKNVINEINAKISNQNFQISVWQCEVTSVMKIMFLNTGRDEVSKMQKSYSKVELEYFKSILDTLVTSTEHCETRNVCLNLVSHLTKHISLTDAEILLTKWTRNGYLVLNSGKLYLGPRAISEFTSHFRTNCKHYVGVCNLCSELVFVGVTCFHCEMKMHKHCMTRFLERRGVCPSCHKDWREDDIDESQQNETQSQMDVSDDSDEE